MHPRARTHRRSAKFGTSTGFYSGKGSSATLTASPPKLAPSPSAYMDLIITAFYGSYDDQTAAP